MSKWSPNAQLAGLRFSGLFALVLSLHFLYIIVENVLETYIPNSAVLSNPMFGHVPLITVLLSCAVMLRYFLQISKLKASSWESMFLILKDEYALSVYRDGATKSFLVIIHIGMIFYYLSRLQNNQPEVMPFLNPVTISSALMFCSALVFGWVVMRQLKEEEE